jgi:hypothetical protein
MTQKGFPMKKILQSFTLTHMQRLQRRGHTGPAPYQLSTLHLNLIDNCTTRARSPGSAPILPLVQVAVYSVPSRRTILGFSLPLDIVEVSRNYLRSRKVIAPLCALLLPMHGSHLRPTRSWPNPDLLLQEVQDSAPEVSRVSAAGPHSRISR